MRVKQGSGLASQMKGKQLEGTCCTQRLYKITPAQHEVTAHHLKWFVSMLNPSAVNASDLKPMGYSVTNTTFKTRDLN